MLRLLQLSQLWRVWRTDVYCNVIRDFVYELEARKIILGRFFQWRDLALADTYTEHARRPMSFHPSRKRSRAIVIEPRAIDQRLVLTQSEQSRSRIARLWMVSDSARFNETKPERRQWLQCDSIFIQACGKPDWIRERQTKFLNS